MVPTTAKADIQMTGKLDLVLAALPSLKPADLAAVQAAAGALLQAAGVAPSPNQNNALAFIYEAYADVLGINSSQAKFERSKHGPIFIRNAPVLQQFIDNHFAATRYKNVVVAKALTKWLVQLIAQELKASKIPINKPILAESLGSISRVFNRAYPRYLESRIAEYAADRALGLKALGLTQKDR